MPNVALTKALFDEYQRLFDTVEYTCNLALVTALAGKLPYSEGRYKSVGMLRSVSWLFVGAVHLMESGGNFDRHLHNGDPLTDRTVHVPSGRPKTGQPPFSWEDSASDALSSWRFEPDRSLPRLLWWIERFNGWGYRLHHPETLSPYLWAGSTHYQSGKYGADGVWSPGLVSKQVGAAVILRRLFEVRPDLIPGWNTLLASISPAWRFMSTDLVAVRQLQQALNCVQGVYVMVDGVAGNRTSDAFKKVYGAYLPGDPRNV